MHEAGAPTDPAAERQVDFSVDLSDLSAVPDGFAASYTSAQYDFAADLACDGEENLLDVVFFVLDFGPSCP